MAMYDVNGNEFKGFANEFKSEADLIQLYENAIGTIQGSCTDGDYIYFGFSSQSRIVKYNILTKEATNHDYNSGLGHANDMTYNPSTGKIYIATMESNGVIAVIDSATMAQESSIDLKDDNNTVIPIYGIAYDRKSDRYITADSGTNGKNFSIFDSNFEYISTVTIERDESYTMQGIETDGDFIYQIMWDSTNNLNYIFVRDMDFELIERINVPEGNEVEDISTDWDGNWYLISNFASTGGGRLYYCNFKSMSLGTIKQVHKLIDAYE